MVYTIDSPYGKLTLPDEAAQLYPPLAQPPQAPPAPELAEAPAAVETPTLPAPPRTTAEALQQARERVGDVQVPLFPKETMDLILKEARDAGLYGEPDMEEPARRTMSEGLAENEKKKSLIPSMIVEPGKKADSLKGISLPPEQERDPIAEKWNAGSEVYGGGKGQSGSNTLAQGLTEGPGAAARVDAAVAKAPTSTGGASTSAGDTQLQQLAQEGAARAAQRALVGNGPAVRVPAHDELKNFRVEKGLAELPPELQQAVADAYGMGAGLAGENAAARAAQQAASAYVYAQQAQNARLELAAMRERQRVQEAQLAQRFAQVEQHAANIREAMRVDPVESYWQKKGAVGTILANIGIVLGAGAAAAGHGPNFAYDRIKDEINQNITAQKNALGAASDNLTAEVSLLGQLRGSMLSPDAAESVASGLLAQAVSAEIMGQLAKKQGVQDVTAGRELAQKFYQDYVDWLAKAKREEADKVVEQWAHKEATVLGGGGGKDPLVAAFHYLTGPSGKGLGLKPAEAWNVLAGNPVFQGSLTRAQQAQMQNAQERVVKLDDSGHIMFATQPKIAATLQEEWNANEMYVRNMTEIHDLMTGPFETLPGGTKAKIEALVAQNRYYLKKSLIKEALTVGELRNYEPLTGERAVNFLSIQGNTEDALEQAKAGAALRKEMIVRQLYPTPEIMPGMSVGLPAGTEQAGVPEGAKRVR